MIQSNEIHEKKLIYQTEEINYEEVYRRNHLEIVSNEFLVQIIADLLTEIVSETDKIKESLLTKFTAKTKPSISIKEYLNRISRCAHCSQECFILALIYIDRISENNRNFVINSLNIHR
jgi:tRNA(Ile)-lysidine synthase TilS/MesJ